MKNYLHMKIIKFKIFLVCLGLSLWGIKTSEAQIGIDNPNPNPYASLDMKATNKGLLVTRVTTTERFAILSNCSGTCPDGLMVFDIQQSAFYYLFSNKWLLLSPFIASDATNGVAEDMQTHTIVQNLGIATSPTTGYKLDINGKFRISNGLDVSSGKLNLLIGNLAMTGGNLYASNNIRANSITGSGTLTTGDFSSNPTTSGVSGPVPKGGIIMWSGSVATIPAGWALCDGNNGTPDLSGKFIIGSGTRTEKIKTQSGTTVNGSDITFNVNESNGADEVILAENHLPLHKHNVTTQSINHDHKIIADDGGGGVYSDVPSPNIQGQFPGDCENCMGDYYGFTEPSTHNHTANQTDAGNDEAHFNTPPYFVLAYIMKL